MAPRPRVTLAPCAPRGHAALAIWRPLSLAWSTSGPSGVHREQRLVAAKGNTQLARFDKQFLPALEEFRKHLGLPPLPVPVVKPMEPVRTPATDRKKISGAAKRSTARPPRRASSSRPVTIPTTPFLPEPERKTNGNGSATTGVPDAPCLPGVDGTPREESPRLHEKAEVSTVTDSPALASMGVIPHLFPLRSGLLATLLLPSDLTRQEARRLTAFLESLAVPDGPAASGEESPNGSSARPHHAEGPDRAQQQAVIAL